MPSTTTIPGPLAATDDTTERRLRGVLRANAAFSTISGAVLALAGSDVAARIGVDQVGLVRLTGLGLVVFAAGVARASRRPRPRLDGEALMISVADASWVVASVVAIMFGWFDTSGVLLVGVVAVIVADLGIAEAVFRARLRS